MQKKKLMCLPICVDCVSAHTHTHTHRDIVRIQLIVVFYPNKFVRDRFPFWDVLHIGDFFSVHCRLSTLWHTRLSHIHGEAH